MEPWSKMNWGLGNSMLVVDPGQQLNSGQVLGELGRITDGLSGKFGRGRDSTDLFWEEESSSKFSGSCDSPLIDLKLGNIHNSGFSEETMILSSSESIAPPKKVRAVVVSNQVAYCQVYGCNKDLSSSKDYHKRHKVCEVHSKTARVIVNGIEQRFCQQCSRFHLLAEFDDGKRSCRKRLAGHNERRRKPQVSFHPGRAGRFLQPYSDGKLQGNTFSTSFICRDILPGTGLLHPERYGRNDCHGQIKFEEKTNCDPMSINFFQYQQLQSSSSFPCMFEKELSPYHINSTSSTSLDMFTNIGRYQQEREGLNSDFAIFDTASAIEGFCGISESGCALSLLSSQSQNSSSHTSGIPMDQSLITTGTQSQHSITQDSENLRTGVSDRIIQGSDFLNAKDRCLDQPEDGATINLFQLSSQLQRVDHERQFVHASPESDAFFCLRTT